MKAGFRHRLLIYFVAVLARYAVYLLVFRLQRSNPLSWDADIWEYLTLAKAILAGDWSQPMFVLRTPGYPLFLAGLSGLAGGSGYLMTLLQILITSLTPTLGYRLAHHVTADRRLALGVGLVMALDPAAVSAELPLLSEALAGLLATGAYLFLYLFLRHGRGRDFLAGAVLLALHLLVRPAVTYYVFLVATVILAVNWRWWRQAATLVAICAIPVVIWTARNLHYTGIRAYSTTGPYTLLFYKAVSTEAFLTGRSPREVGIGYAQEIERRLGHPERVPEVDRGAGLFENLYPADAARYAAIDRLSREKMLEYWPWHLLLLPAGYEVFIRNAPLVARLFEPGQFAINGLACLLVLLGLVVAARRRRLGRPFWLLSVSTMLYYGFLYAFSNPGLATTRFRSPFGVFWSIYLAVGLLALAQWYRRSRPRAARVVQ